MIYFFVYLLAGKSRCRLISPALAESAHLRTHLQTLTLKVGTHCYPAMASQRRYYHDYCCSIGLCVVAAAHYMVIICHACQLACH